VDSIISEKEIHDIPLFSRNFMDLAALAPGVYARDGANIDPSKSYGYRGVSVAGRTGRGTRIEIDGVDVTDVAVGSTVANISNDAVHEFQLSRSSLDVSTPMASGAISIITKSGGNELHGTGFWDYYSPGMGARLGYSQAAEQFRRNRGGGSAGGPVLHNKLFWFANLERTWQTAQMLYSAPEFPQLNADTAVPVGTRFAKGRADWNLKPTVRLFYSFPARLEPDHRRPGDIAVPEHQLGEQQHPRARRDAGARHALLPLRVRELQQSHPIAGIRCTVPQNTTGVSIPLERGDVPGRPQQSRPAAHRRASDPEHL
jgi:hypothetical protein